MAAAESAAAGGATVAACRAVLRARRHPLAEEPMRVELSSVIGDYRIDVLAFDEDGARTLWLTTAPNGDRSIAIVHPDGRREDL